jgi:hypothetical protein
MNATPGLLLALVRVVREGPGLSVKDEPSLVPVRETTAEFGEKALSTRCSHKDVGTELELVT